MLLPRLLPTDFLRFKVGRDDMEVFMAAFSDGINELNGVLIRLTANCSSLATLALRYALISLSFQRLGVPLRAAQNQLHAIRALQAVIEQPLPWDEADAFRAVAASVVLYIFEMQNAESSMNWVVYFDGARRIAEKAYKGGGDNGCDAQLLMDWVFSHCTMYQFSFFYWVRREYPQAWLARQRRLVHTSVSSPLRQVILPLYGCSLELLDTLHDVLLNCLDRTDSEYMSQRHKDILDQLTDRLQNLIQRERVGDDRTDSPQSSHARQVAEAFRLAALLFLERVARNSRRDAPRVARLRSEAFALLGNMRICDRPWPLFVLSIEAEDGDQRRLTLAMMERIMKRGPQAKFAPVCNMVREAWALQDLAVGDEIDALDLYRALIQSSRLPPLFG
ncbi:uncharacterized protein BHQ10_002842 [Talaromyces amestolkiae]|uniref:Transcription factor domain-containing protein n=1 Tax=Talaromyces amestolkiae TaxID=1196081 RepID=A0A364KTE8_TALAM|nr:uncharacterized protein BHQ10_002842 [Talaromyces amestolkiae]RAO66830.1 hypothetical protein BHQ10_002842 [Talaromyces amestolkiae]